MLSDSGWRRMISPVRCRIRPIAWSLQAMRLCRLSTRHVRLLAISKFLYWLVVVSVTRQLFCIAPSHSIRTTTLSAPLAEQKRPSGGYRSSVLAHSAWKIWIEDQSTNCGENARFSIALLKQAVEPQSSYGYRCSGPHHAAAHDGDVPPYDWGQSRCTTLVKLSRIRSSVRK